MNAWEIKQLCPNIEIEKHGFNSQNSMENIEKIYYSQLLWL